MTKTILGRLINVIGMIIYVCRVPSRLALCMHVLSPKSYIKAVLSISAPTKVPGNRIPVSRRLAAVVRYISVEV